METGMACQDLHIYLSVLLLNKMVATSDWNRHFVHQNNDWVGPIEFQDVYAYQHHQGDSVHRPS